MEDIRSRVWPRVGAMAHELPCGPDEAEQLISLLRGFDLRAVQLGVPLLEEVMAKRELMATWRAQLEAASLPILALGGYRNLIAPDETKRERNIAFLQRCLEMARQFGTAVVATETGTYNRKNDWSPSAENQGQEAWDTFCATLRELLPVAEQHGTILAVEGHVNHVINTPERLARLLEQFPTPHLQVVLDPFNYLGQELLARKEQVVATFLQQFKDRFVLAHLKDVHHKGAAVDTPAFGQGVFPQPIYLDFLRKECPDLPLIIEHVSVDRIPEVLHKLLVALGKEPEGSRNQIHTVAIRRKDTR
jgi:sugar phosphate isomerase/epimerase